MLLDRARLYEQPEPERRGVQMLVPPGVRWHRSELAALAVQNDRRVPALRLGKLLMSVVADVSIAPMTLYSSELRARPVRLLPE